MDLTIIQCRAKDVTLHDKYIAHIYELGVIDILSTLVNNRIIAASTAVEYFNKAQEAIGI